MAIFSFFKKKAFFSDHQKHQIEDTIRKAEKKTSAEIRVFVESHNYLVDPLERAKEVFLLLNMDKTAKRNAVLIYIAIKHRELALFADEGIYNLVGKDFWNHAVQEMIKHFKSDNIVKGIENCIEQIGQTLKDKFPYDAGTDENELPDDIVFGD